MTDQSSADALTLNGAAFDAFRKRARGGILLRAALVFFVIAALLYTAFFALAGAPMLAAFQNYIAFVQDAVANGAKQPPSPELALQRVFAIYALFPYFMLIGLAVSVFFAAYEAACLRWLVRGDASGAILGLDFGADTWRVWLGYVVWFFIRMAAVICIELGGAILGGITFAIVSMSNPNNLPANIAAFIGVFALAFLVGMCAWAWISVRYAPAAACSIALQRLSFFKAWDVTRGRFWALFGNFALLFLLYFVAAIIIEGCAVAFILFTSMPALQALGAHPGLPAVWSALGQTPNLIALAIAAALMSIVFFVFVSAMFGVNARAVLLGKQDGRI